LAIQSFVDSKTQVLNTTISRINREIDLLREYRTRMVADEVTGKLDARAAALPQDELAFASQPGALATDAPGDDSDDFDGDDEAECANALQA
jgi:type I restriction enzyme S subunit